MTAVWKVTVKALLDPTRVQCCGGLSSRKSSLVGVNPFLDRSKGPICYGGIAATCHRGRRSSYLSLREGGSFLNAHARHFIVSAYSPSGEAQQSERDDILRRKSNLRGSEAKSDPRAQCDERHHVS